MAMIQGVENIDVPIPMKSMEAELVGDAESKILAQLNAQGKRVVRIDHTTRPGGFGEFSGTHATITVLWEADTESNAYKDYINKENAKKAAAEEFVRQAKAEKEAKRQKTREEVEKNPKRTIYCGVFCLGFMVFLFLLDPHGELVFTWICKVLFAILGISLLAMGFSDYNKQRK